MDTTADERFARIGTVARWKPVHLGHQAMLRAICDRCEHALIGIGSANRYDVRNPFTVEETRDMIALCLGERAGWEVVEVPDLGHGPRWRAMVIERFGDLDLFATANGYVRDLLTDHYRVVHPVTLVPEGERVAVDGTMVREAIARGGDWTALVPATTARYLTGKGLIERFRREFGLETLARGIPGDPA